MTSAGAIWSSQMPSRLAHYLPFLSQSERNVLFGSITEAGSKPRGHPIREGVISGAHFSLFSVPASFIHIIAAYGDVMKTMILVATAVSVFPISIAFTVPDWMARTLWTA
jgi:hypothetical protein